jgi:DMSO/TMAO reductase YedYZ molybdopterin-dependent catalytic subunit
VNNKQKIAFSAATITIIVIVLSASLIYLTGTHAQANSLPAGQPPQAQLKITGDVQAEEPLTIQDLAQMPLTNVAIAIESENASYVGITMLELLNRTAAWDAGLINVIASDGSNQSFNTYQALNSTEYVGNEIILAFAKDGKWITDNTEGPLKLITPGLAGNVKNVVEISLQPWTINITGTTNPLALTGSDIANFEAKTVQAAFAPGGEPQRTSNWTGVSLYSILQSGGIPAGASKVTVTAIDGYSRNFTVQQVLDTGMLVGFKENGQYLTPNGGQPYRLFIPTEDFKWGQYWVRWVCEITVS